MADQGSSSEAINLISLSLKPDWATELVVSPWIWGFLSLLIIGLIFLRYLAHGSILRRGFEIDSAELGVGDSKLTFRPNINDKTVAYKIWVELSTRKIGLEIDFDHDVISEIYDSWYAFFAVTRELIKDIPVSKVREKSTKKVINLSIDVLNLGLRPHLTKWQARFRRWYTYKIDQDVEAKLHPQDIQKEFASYDELVEDMKRVNSKLIAYRVKMDQLVHT